MICWFPFSAFTSAAWVQSLVWEQRSPIQLLHAAAKKKKNSVLA